MGIHDRDYYRDDGRGWNPGDLRAVPVLIAFTVGVFVVQLFSAPGAGVPDPLFVGGAFSYQKVMDGEVWRVVTSFFVNTYSLLGIVLGMLGLYWFGTEMEAVYGTRRFVTFYVVAGVVVNLGKLALGAMDVDPDKPTVGAGGPLFAVLTLYALHYPARQILLMLVIPVPVGALVALLTGVYVLLFATGDKSKMEIAVPLVGAAFGFVYYKLGGNLFGVLGERVRRRERPRLTLRPALARDEEAFDEESVPTPDPPTRAGRPDEYLEAKLDAVLEKVARTGRDSLTAEENAVLMKASEVYKQKRR